MIPARQPFRIFGPGAEEDSEVVHPGGRKQNVVVELHSLPQAASQRIKPRLVAKLVYRQCFDPNVGLNRFAPIGSGQRVTPGQLGAMRIRSSPPRSSIEKAGEEAGTATMPRAGRSIGAKVGLEIRPVPAAANR